MSIIDNGRINSIKKQIFLVLSLFFSCSNLGAVACPQTVGTTTPGEGLWNVLTRVGAATNVIESQICALNFGTDLACSFSFGQADIGSGGIYTISVPGTYCMTENVTFTFGPAITINANNVTLDLQGHYIDGGSNPVLSAIQLATGVGSTLHSITIQNGTIQNLSGSLPRGIGQGGTNSSLVNIVVRDIDFFNIIGTTGIGYAFNATSQGILIENCTTFNGGAIWALMNAGSSAIIRNIRAEQYDHGFAEILAEAPSGRGASVVIEDCIMTTSAPVGVSAFAYIEAAFTANAVVRNCVVDGGTNLGFLLLNVENGVVSDCIAQNVDSIGFSIAVANSFSIVLERCVAQYNGQQGFRIGANMLRSVNVTDCRANNNTSNGFSVESIASIDAITFKNCYAAQNDVCGFLLNNHNGGEILNAGFDGCVAQDNGGDGFNLDNTPTALRTFANIFFNDCVSQGNSGGGIYLNSTYLGDGFGVNSSTNGGRVVGSTVNNVVFNNCVAQQNGNDGFDFGAASNKVDTISCQHCTAEQNALHGMNFSSTSTNCEVYKCLMANNGGNGINNLNPLFGPSSANIFISNKSFKNAGVDYFQINNGVNGQPFFSSSNEAFVQGASPWANMST